MRISLRIAVLVLTGSMAFAGCGEDAPPLAPEPQNLCAPAQSPAELVDRLAGTYNRRDYDCLVTLFPAPDDSLEFRFLFNEPLPDGTWSWDLEMFLRVHRRLFDPEHTPPFDPPLPADLWLQASSMTLGARTSFTERPDLYRDQGGLLDRSHWRAVQADYDVQLFVDTRSETDYRVQTMVDFVIVENLQKTLGEPRKFLFYRIEELGTRMQKSSESKSWARILAMYM